MKKIIIAFLCLALFSCGADSDSVGSNNGTLSGSYANMLVIGDFLYIISETELITYELTDPQSPTEINRETLAFGVESLLHQSGILFIGSRTAMHIYKIENNGIPAKLSETEYGTTFDVTPCDPIVANDTLAIASLSSRIEQACGFSNINELRFFDISDLTSPVLVNRFSMAQPLGMALVGSHLFVCQSNSGLSVLNITEPQNPSIIFNDTNVNVHDVIATNDVLFAVGPTEIYLFDYTDINNITLRSTITI